MTPQPERICSKCQTYRLEPGKALCYSCVMSFLNSPANLARTFPNIYPAINPAINPAPDNPPQDNQKHDQHNHQPPADPPAAEPILLLCPMLMPKA